MKITHLYDFIFSSLFDSIFKTLRGILEKKLIWLSLDPESYILLKTVFWTNVG